MGEKRKSDRDGGVKVERKKGGGGERERGQKGDKYSLIARTLPSFGNY